MADGKIEQGKKIGELINKCWSDEAFKSRVLTDTMSVLKENSITVPKGVSVKALENTDRIFNIVIPAKPAQENASNETAKAVAGGDVGKLISKAWSDKAFKDKILKDTMSVLKEYAIAVPEGVTVKAVENTDKVFYLVIPQRQTHALSDSDLDQVVGGKGRLKNAGYYTGCGSIANEYNGKGMTG